LLAVKPGPTKSALSWLEAANDASLYLSVLTPGEIQKGIAKRRSSDEKRALKYEAYLHEKIVRQFQDRILPLDLDVLLKWGELTGRLAAEGKPLPVVDGLIAATAAVHDMILVTRNEKDFQNLGLSIVNPWDS
jgi:predicted nucleic acid-binding protein